MSGKGFARLTRRRTRGRLRRMTLDDRRRRDAYNLLRGHHLPSGIPGIAERAGRLRTAQAYTRAHPGLPEAQKRAIAAWVSYGGRLPWAPPTVDNLLAAWAKEP